jgi:HSP20 family molecular chaperone IbpA
MTRLSEIGESARNAVLEQVGRGMSRVQERTPLRHDVLESDDEYLVVFDAPGASRSDVQVRFVDNAVEVRIDRFRDFYEDFEMRFPGRGLSLQGRAELPDEAVVRPADSTATLTDRGELRVRIPKDERGRSVAVADEETEDIELGTGTGTETGTGTGNDTDDAGGLSESDLPDDSAGADSLTDEDDPLGRDDG